MHALMLDITAFTLVETQAEIDSALIVLCMFFYKFSYKTWLALDIITITSKPVRPQIFQRSKNEFLVYSIKTTTVNRDNKKHQAQ